LKNDGALTANTFEVFHAFAAHGADRRTGGTGMRHVQNQALRALDGFAQDALGALLGAQFVTKGFGLGAARDGSEGVARDFAEGPEAFAPVGV
jgi:hypothetical protein